MRGLNRNFRTDSVRGKVGLERAQILAVLTQFPRCNFVVPLQAPEECEAFKSLAFIDLTLM